MAAEDHKKGEKLQSRDVVEAVVVGDQGNDYSRPQRFCHSHDT